MGSVCPSLIYNTTSNKGKNPSFPLQKKYFSFISHVSLSKRENCFSTGEVNNEGFIREVNNNLRYNSFNRWWICVIIGNDSIILTKLVAVENAMALTDKYAMLQFQNPVKGKGVNKGTKSKMPPRP